MKVETFEVTEVCENTVLADEASIAMFEKLGLTGQMTLVGKAANGQEKSAVCPYREMKPEENKVYRLLCPQVTSVEDFQASAIPLRVLQVLEHAKSLDLFLYFEIWAAEGAVKDPVLVAKKERYTNTVFILARWGEELDAWPQLVKKALELWKAKVREELESIIEKVKTDLIAVEQCTTLSLCIKRDEPYYAGYRS
jgi:hypothetical protein